MPGGPELPGYGRVFKVNAATGALRTVAKGFTGATDLAVADDGTIYVTELFAFQVSTVAPGDHAATSSSFVDCPTAVEVDVRRSTSTWRAVGSVDLTLDRSSTLG